MAKKLRIALMACLTICLVLIAGVFAACNGKEELPENTYKVTVQYEDGSAVTNVAVQLCKVEDDGSLGLCLMPVIVDENGVALVSQGVEEGAIYHIQINNLPSENTYEDITTTAGQFIYQIIVK